MPTRSPSYYGSRGRSRTRSPYTPYTRSRGRSRSADSRYSDRSYYSDTFHSDGSRGRRRSRSRTPPSNRTYNKPGVRAGARKTNAKKPIKKSGAATSTPRPGGVHDVVTKRMLSARRLKINELRNEIDTLMKALNEIRSENKSLKRDNVLQNKQLDRLQDQEGELPQMIDSHNREVRVLKEQIRKWKDKNERVSRNLRNTEDELSRSQKKVKRLQEIADDKKLEERDELSRRLGKAENDLEERTHRMQQLERHIENLEKSHRREIVTELKKHAALKLELEATHSDLEYTKVHLRDREKELEVRNIYQNRIALAQRGGSVASLPALEPPARYQPPPKSPEISPRHRAKQFEQKRREEQKAKAKEKQKKAAPTQKPTDPKPNTDTIKQPNNGAIMSTEPKPPDTPKFETENSWDAIFKKQQQISGSQPTKDSLEDSFTSSFNKRLADEHRAREREEQERREKQQREEQRWQRQQEQEERDRRNREEKERRDREESERRDREERRRRDREESERKAREERDRYEREQQRQQNEEREAREKEAQRARETEERERRFREEAEQRARVAREQEKQRLESDARAAEERRKKDLLLQKMKEIDSGSSAPPPALGLQSKASLTNSDSTFGGDFFLTSGDGDATTKNKDYSFRRTDENLFRGLPANKTSAAKSTSLFGADSKPKDNPLFSGGAKGSLFEDNDDDLDFGGYQPSSFASGKPAASRVKPKAESNNTWKVKDSGNDKTNVISDIFGDESFSSRKPKADPSEQKSSFPWDSDNNKPSTPNKILPLRPRANHGTIHNKPTVRAIDDFDDDLEEVVL